MPDSTARSSDLPSALTQRSIVLGTLATPLVASNALARPTTRTILNDASRLNLTLVVRHLTLSADETETFVAALRTELKEAQSA